MTKIIPVVLCGGVGSRLWPMSRSQSPKQFHPVDGSGSLSFFQSTLQRHRGSIYEPPVVVSAARHLPTLRRQLSMLQSEARIIAEPVARNTGPAVLAAALEIAQTDPDALMLVLPSDHVISGNLDDTVERCVAAAEANSIVLFGVTPDYPETGYGYIMDGGASGAKAGLQKVARFVEKPPIELATELCSSGNAYWASGISMFSARAIIEEFRKHDRKTLTAVTLAHENCARKAGELHLATDAFRRAQAEPTERLIFENSDRVVFTPVNISWSDVGSWTAIHGVGTADDNGNVFYGDVIATDTTNALVRADERLIAVVGVPEVIVIDTPDALLVTRRGSCQDVKKVVETLQHDKRCEAIRHSHSEHNWGRSYSLVRSGAYEMLLLRINAGTTVHIDPLPGRKLIMVRGELDLFDGLRRRRLGEGEHAGLDNLPTQRMTNGGDDDAEALLLTLRSTVMKEAETEAEHHAL